MNIKLGEKIRSLRKERDLSQEVLAQYLGVSFQSVSKWENGSAMPDITMIPAIASFFEISTDELFNFNILEIEKRVEKLCYDAAQFRSTDPEKSEKMLRSALRQYPGNDIILNNLLYTMRSPERNQEVVDICKALIESTKHDNVRFDALRILAETYKAMGEYTLCKDTIARIPEIYFTKLQLDALLLEGDDMYESACEQKHLAAEMLLDMMLRLADYYESKGDTVGIRQELTLAVRLAQVMKDDPATPFHNKSFHEYYGKEVIEIADARLRKLPL